MEKTVVLFGAGAEVSFGMADGGEFASEVLGLENGDMTDEIKKFFKNIKDEWYPKPVLKHEWKQKDLLDAAKKKELLDSYEKYNSKKQFEVDVSKKIKGKKEQQAFINKYSSYMGLLDERFHTLIYPNVLGAQKFWSVVACYWRAYLSLVSNYIKEKNYALLIEKPGVAYKRMVEKAEKQRNKDSYYKIIADMQAEKPKVITANYTPLCASICGLDDNSIAYLHGSFKWFEMPKELNVLDVSDGQTNPRGIYFPFIFLQSGVKPIVHPIQIKEYAKAMDFLDDSYRLIVVGYKANHDDNHLNSLLRDYLMKGKRIQYIDYDNVGKDIILKRLHIFENMENLEIIPIDEKDNKEKGNKSLAIFKKLLGA